MAGQETPANPTAVDDGWGHAGDGQNKTIVVDAGNDIIKPPIEGKEEPSNRGRGRGRGGRVRRGGGGRGGHGSSDAATPVSPSPNESNGSDWGEAGDGRKKVETLITQNSADIGGNVGTTSPTLVGVDAAQRAKGRGQAGGTETSHELDRPSARNPEEVKLPISTEDSTVTEGVIPRPKRAPEYLNPDRHKTGGTEREKITEDQLAEKMERIRLQNEKLKERNKEVQEDAEQYDEWRKEEEARRQKDLHLQKTINAERAANAERKLNRVDGREWDRDKDHQAERGSWRGRGGRGRGRGRDGAPEYTTKTSSIPS